MTEFPEFPDDDYPPDYPGPLAPIKVQNTARDNDLIFPNGPYTEAEVAQAREYNKHVAEFIALYSDIRASIIALGGNPDAGDTLESVIGASGGGGGSFDFQAGRNNVFVQYRAGVAAAQATGAIQIIDNPDNNDTLLLSAISFATGDAPAQIRFKSVLGSVFLYDGGSGELFVRLEGTKEATLQNVVDALNTNTQSPSGQPWKNAATASRATDVLTATLNDFTSTWENQTFYGGEQTGDNNLNFTPLTTDADAGAGSYGGGANAQLEEVVGAAFSNFELDAITPASGPSVLIFGKVKEGTHLPETAPVYSGDLVIDQVLSGFITQAGIIPGISYRGFDVQPTKDLVVGTGQVDFTWAGKPFTIIVTKVVNG